MNCIEKVANFFPYKEEVTGSNPVAPTKVFQNLPYKKLKRHTKDTQIIGK